MTQVLVYVTARSHDEALDIARTVVFEQLAACANILGAMTSVYRWQGAIHEDAEVALLLKTRRGLVEALSERIIQLHPYDCPCVVAIDISGGNPAFLEWITTQCGEDGSDERSGPDA